MAESKHQVSIRIAAENRTRQAWDSIRRDMSSVEGGVLKLNRVLGTLGVGLSVGGLVAFAKSGIDAADALNKQAQSVGVSVENLQAYQRAAKFAGVEGEQFNQSLARLAKGINDAAAGTGEAKDAFAALRVSVTNAGGGLKSTDEILLEVSDAFQKMGNGTRKTGLAVDLFGQRIGPQLIPFLNQGRAGVAAAREELDRFGQLISTETAVAAENFNDDLLRLKGTVDALKVSLVSGALPALSRFTNELLAAQKATGGLLSGFFVQFASDTTNLQAELEKVDTLLARLRQQREDLAAPGFAMGLNRLLSSDLEDTERQIKAVEARRAFLLELGRQRGFGQPTGDTGLPTPPLLPPPGVVDKAAAAKREAELKKADDAIRKSLIEPYVQAAEETVKISDEMVFTWNAAGERIEVPKEKFAEFEEALKKPTAAVQAMIDLYDREQKEAIANGAILTQDITEDAKRLEAQTRRNSDAAREFGLTFVSALEDSIIEMKSAREIAQALFKDIARIFLRQQVTEPLLGAFKGFDLGSIFGGGIGAGAPTSGVPTPLQLSGPFQHGGSFTVGGSGGTDRTFVGFRATAGEQVTVTPPGQGAGVVNHFHVDMRGATAEAVTKLERLVREVNGSIERRAVSAVADARLRGGSFAGAFER